MKSAQFSSPICARVSWLWYQASGSALMTRCAPATGLPRKNQCHQAWANRASQRASASPMGTASATIRWLTASGWSMASRNAT